MATTLLRRIRQPSSPGLLGQIGLVESSSTRYARLTHGMNSTSFQCISTFNYSTVLRKLQIGEEANYGNVKSKHGRFSTYKHTELSSCVSGFSSSSLFRTDEKRSYHGGIAKKKIAGSGRGGVNRLIIVGSGVAGCAAALTAAEKHNIPVTLVCAGSQLVDCNSYWAQGGIIYRNYDPKAEDSAESLVKDVHRAGAGLCQDDAVWKLANEGPEKVRELLLDDRDDQVFANVPFDRDDHGELSCCLEASHSAPRIIHYADHSGKAITEHITAAAASHPLIKIVNNTVVTDLIMSDTSSEVCVGVRMLNSETGMHHDQLTNKGVVLASGGLGGIFEHSTNPSGFNALGSSVGLARRAGAECKDLEYVQFHPTSLYIPGEARFLLTEALRGEGAILRDGNGRAFAKDFHPDGELAPRDIVARGVFEWSQKESKGHNAYLDISHRDPDWLKQRFPSIQRHLRQRGLDITRDMLPVIPAAHYTCGGIATDLNGCTSIPGLYAAGESARTGLHGGNRLASTSLLEGLVFGAAVSDFIGGSEEGTQSQEILSETVEDMRNSGNSYRKESNVASYNLAQRNSKAAVWLLSKLRQTMWDKVGVVRTPSGTLDAVEMLGGIRQEACDLYDEAPTLETAGLRDAAYSGEAVARAASMNQKSAGAHFITQDTSSAVPMEDDSEDEIDAREASQ